MMIMVLIINKVATVEASYSDRNTATVCEYIWKQNSLEMSSVCTYNDVGQHQLNAAC
jgi:hypothetical protein